MSKTVFLKQTTGGFVVELAGAHKTESVHTDLPCALAAASDLLQPLELDKPELSQQHKEILQSLVDGTGCVFEIDDNWRWFYKGSTVYMPNTTKDMLILKLLTWDGTSKGGINSSGMTKIANITDAGREALKR